MATNPSGGVGLPSGSRPIVRTPPQLKVTGQPRLGAGLLPGARRRPAPVRSGAPGSNPNLPTGGVSPTPPGAPRAPAGPATPPASAVPPTWHPDLSGDRWMGYLTPDQLGALQQAGDQYVAGVTDNSPTGPRVTAAQANYAADNAASQLAHDEQTSQANQELAARGMFQSSIRANDLADLDRSLVARQSAAQSTLNFLTTEAQNAITSLTNSWTHTQDQYHGLAAINAAQQQPPAAPAGAAPASPPLAPPGATPGASTFGGFTPIPGRPAPTKTYGGASPQHVATNVPKPPKNASKSFHGGPVMRRH